jgi:hypothetical protein
LPIIPAAINLRMSADFMFPPNSTLLDVAHQTYNFYETTVNETPRRSSIEYWRRRNLLNGAQVPISDMRPTPGISYNAHRPGPK